MATVREEIAKNLLHYRKKCNLTQREFAEKLGVKNSAVSNWENSLNSIDIDTLHRACGVFGITVNDMYGVFANLQSEQYLPQEKQLIHNFRSLNQEGQEKAADYVSDLIETGRYKKLDKLRIK